MDLYLDLKDELISEEGVSLVGKEQKGHCSWGAKRLGKVREGGRGSRIQMGKWVFCSRHVESEDLEGISGPVR